METPENGRTASSRDSRWDLRNRKLWDLEWKNVNYSIPVKAEAAESLKAIFKKKKEVQFKKVLERASGSVKHGQAIAILGPSGAGKSTLLNVLAGRITTGIPTGSITINGEKRDSSWKTIAAYVEQADIMYSMLTVKETITFAAMLKLPSTMSNEEKEHCVESTIRMLGLAPVSDARIGNSENRGISGGEKKRVSIAIELVTDPGLIFLDEPTSGLDAFTAQTITDKITDLAVLEQRTVLLTIHQPRIKILEQFTKIILISMGQIVFFGAVHEAIEHFKDQGYECPEYENPADFFLDLITIDQRSEQAREESTIRVKKLIAAWKQDEGLHEEEAAAPSSTDTTSQREPLCCEVNNFNATIPAEIGYLMQRYFRVQYRDIQTVVGSIIQTLIVATLLSFVFFQLGDDFGSIQSRVGLLFFIPINQMFVIIVPLIDSFTKDREIILRERYSATYRILSAYLGKFISLLPLQFVLTTIFCFMIYYITGLRTDGFQYFLIFYGFNLLLALDAIALGLWVAASVPTSEIGQIVGPLAVVVFLIFGGALANTNQITWILRWIQYLSPIFYCYTALIQNELSGRQFGELTGDEYLDLYSSNTVSIVWCMGAMLILFISFLTFGFLSIRVTTRPKMVLI